MERKSRRLAFDCGASPQTLAATERDVSVQMGIW